MTPDMLPWHLAKHIKIDRNGCWLWQSEINRNGYGTFKKYVNKKRKRYMTHIVAYKSLIGDYDEGLLLDHKCRVRNCCNPKHLEPVTHQVNTIRGEAVLFKKAVDHEV